MLKSSYAANIWKFYLYRALRFPLLWAPVYVVFFQEVRGFSLTQIGILDSIFWLSIALGELPTGIIADRYGRKNSVLLGTILYTGAVWVYANAASFGVIAVSMVLWGLAITLASGADEALLYESLRLSGRGDNYSQAVARAETIKQLAQVVGALVGGLLALISLGLPLQMSAVLGAVTILAVLSFKEPRSPVDPDRVRSNMGQVLGEALRLLRERPNLFRTILYIAIIPVGPIAIAFTYIQPYTLAIGLPLSSLGFAVMAMRLASGAGAILAPSLARRFGTGSILLAIPIVTAGALIFLAGTPSLAGLGLIALIGFMVSMALPLVMVIVQNSITDNVRATIISLQSLLFTLFSAIMFPIYGLLADNAGLSAVFIASAILLLFYGLFEGMTRRQALQRFHKSKRTM